MSLDRFFAEVGPFLRGQIDVAGFLERAGPTTSPEGDLAFYPWLVAFDQRRILAELCPTAKTLVDRSQGLDWDALVDAYVAVHPPTAWSVPAVGERFADWLAARRVEDPDQPAALECLADLYWTRFQARTAPDAEGIGVDRRLFLRHYPIDVLTWELHLLDRTDAPPDRPSTLVVFRHAETCDVRHLVPTLATLAVLARLQGHPLAGPLAELSDEALTAEQRRLTHLGVLPQSW